MSEIIERNLQALPEPLGSKVARSARGRDAGRFCLTRARSGLVVTGLLGGGREHYFHSTYDPRKEAERLSALASASTVIVLGFGTGHHLAALLDRAETVIVVEPEVASIAFALQHVDLSSVLAQPGLHIIAGDSAAETDALLRATYLPAVHGSASVIELPGRVSSAPDLFNSTRSALGETLDAIASDFAAQARFGRLWLRNTVANLAFLQAHSSPATMMYPDLSGREVIVTAAGPSLNASLSTLETARDRFVLATDTSLPTLVSSGIVPDGVITVDCQLVSYSHYLTAGFPDTILFADLSAAPSVLETAVRVGPLLSGHPLHALLGRLGANLISFDSSGGNVTHAAVDLAGRLGAASVTVVGADYAYPRGEPYARGAYVDTYFGARATRTTPHSALLYHFVQDRPGIYTKPDAPDVLRLPLLDRYADDLTALASRLRIPVHRGERRLNPGRSMAASGDTHAPGPASRIAPSLPPDILDMLANLIDEVSAPAHLAEALRRGAGPIAAEAPEIAVAILPLVAWLRRVMPDEPLERLLDQALHDASEVVAWYRDSARPQPERR